MKRGNNMMLAQESSSIQPSDPTSPAQTSSHPSSSTSHAGAIAGALIGFAVIVIICILIWCARRRKKKSENTLPVHEIATSRTPYNAELPAEERPAELADVKTSHCIELPAPTLSSHQNRSN